MGVGEEKRIFILGLRDLCMCKEVEGGGKERNE